MCLSSNFKPQSTKNTPFKAGSDLSVAATEILYGGQDNLTDLETITAFANSHGASLTVMENGEHWFHTAEQMKFLDAWFENAERKLL